MQEEAHNSMLTRHLFNRHALPQKVKETVMPTPKITERIEDSLSKRKQQTEPNRSAMKLKYRTENSSPISQIEPIRVTQGQN